MTINWKSGRLWLSVGVGIVALIVAIWLISSALAPETSELVLAPTDTPAAPEGQEPTPEETDAPTGEVGAPTETVEATAEPETLEVACLQREGGGGCLRFPTFSGESLSGEEITFPDAFSSEYVLALVLFDREQQERAEAWLATIDELLAAYPTLSFYDIPIFPARLPAPVRLIAKTGLQGMVDEKWHDALVMVFLEEREAFIEAMEIPDFDNVQLFIVNAEGVVLWRIGGDFTEEKGEAVREQIVLWLGVGED